MREPHELEISSILAVKLIPLGQLASRLSEIDSAGFRKVLIDQRTFVL